MQGRRGFKLLELLIVVIILATLAVFAIPRAADASKSAKIKTCNANVALINSQIELYRHKTGSWPNNLTDVTENPAHFPDGPPKCPFDEKYKMQKEHNRYRVIKHSHE
jgi:competence protein ComGC